MNLMPSGMENSGNKGRMTPDARYFYFSFYWRSVRPGTGEV
jgi:hypothetical protein